MNPRVSVVIPTYNRARDLSRALKSVQDQSYTNWEAIVVDNHSDDDTDEIVQGFNDPRIQLLKIHNDGIIAVSRNLGIAHATGEFVALLDSDDWWTREKLALSLYHLDRGADVVYHKLYVVSKPGQRLFLKKTRTRAAHDPMYQRLLRQGNVINNSSVVVRTDLLRQIGGFSEERRLIAVEDYDAWLRIARLSGKFRRIDRTLGFYWAGGGNMSNPQRTLEIADVIEERYGGDRSLGWLHYLRGVSNLRMARHVSADEHFCRVRWRDVPIDLFIRAKLMQLANRVRLAYGK